MIFNGPGNGFLLIREWQDYFAGLLIFDKKPEGNRCVSSRYLHPTVESQRLAVERLGGILDSTRHKVDTASEATCAEISRAPSLNAKIPEN
jgi:hypothetical protein